MSAASQLFHQNLHIHLINRTCRDINYIIIKRKYNTCLNPTDVKKLIGSLRGKNRRAFHALGSHRTKGKSIAVNIRIADRLRFCLVILKVLPENLPDPRNIRAAPPEICRRFKGTDTGLVGKFLRINYNTAVHGIGFRRLYTDSVADVLHHFRNHFTCRGGIRLTVAENGTLYSFRTLSVMIKHPNGMALLML